MRFNTSDLKTERQWRAATGYDKSRFEKLLAIFKESYLALFGQTVADRQAEIEVTPSLPSEEALLLFTLFSLKTGLTYDNLGLVCGMDASNAKRNQQLGILVLEHALTTAGQMPKREFKDAAEFAEYMKNEAELILDGTEQRMQRPGDNEVQKDHYSGKKKAHTVKAMAISNAAKVILYLSLCWAGKTHDYRMLKEEFPPEQDWFANHRVRVDLGFQGMADDYKCKELFIPNKKKKKQELPPEQKEENKVLAGDRIFIEHALGGLKRYRILSDRLRVHDLDLYNEILGVCAGLWNFYLTC